MAADRLAWPGRHDPVDPIPLTRPGKPRYRLDHIRTDREGRARLVRREGRDAVESYFFHDLWMLQWRVFVIGAVIPMLAGVSNPWAQGPMFGLLAATATLVPSMIVAGVLRARGRTLVDFPIARRLWNVWLRRRRDREHWRRFSDPARDDRQDTDQRGSG